MSVADDVAFAALVDASRVLWGPADTQARLIGGLMITIHEARWEIDPRFGRETLDADFGTPLLAAPIFEEIDIALENADYKPTRHYTYERPIDDIAVESDGRPSEYRAVIDLVQVPSVGLDGNPSVGAGSGMFDPVPVVEALARPFVVVDAAIRRRGHDPENVKLKLADETSAVILKAFAWRTRRSYNDPHDLWRTLEIAYRAGCSNADFQSPTGRVVAAVLDEAFGDGFVAQIERLAEVQGMTLDQGLTRIDALRHRLGL